MLFYVAPHSVALFRILFFFKVNCEIVFSRCCGDHENVSEGKRCPFATKERKKRSNTTQPRAFIRKTQRQSVTISIIPSIACENTTIAHLNSADIPRSHSRLLRVCIALISYKLFPCSLRLLTTIAHITFK